MHIATIKAQESAIATPYTAERVHFGVSGLVRDCDIGLVRQKLTFTPACLC